MRVIILAAGQAVQLDGYNKLLIKDPESGDSILDKYLKAFEGFDVTIVLGYRAINVMHEYPDLDYEYNSQWAVTNSSYSLSLTLNQEPCFVINGDFFIEPELVSAMQNSDPDLIATLPRESRASNALNVSIDEGNVIDIYQGKLKQTSDPEAIGIYKITSREILKTWRYNCINHSDLYVGQNLISNSNHNLKSFDVSSFRVDEVNTPLDYLRILQANSKFDNE
tara:strand:+ start:1291 stop:1959 length:669 start_codon:yes stop_codon:yes gene_type:complete